MRPVPFGGAAARPLIAGAAVMATAGALNGWLFIQGEFRWPLRTMASSRQPLPGATVQGCHGGHCRVFGTGVCGSVAQVFGFAGRDLYIHDDPVDPLCFGALPAFGAGFEAFPARAPPHAGRSDAWAVTAVFCGWVIFGCGGEVLLYGGLLLGFGLALHAIRIAFSNRP